MYGLHIIHTTLYDYPNVNSPFRRATSLTTKSKIETTALSLLLGLTSTVSSHVMPSVSGVDVIARNRFPHDDIPESQEGVSNWAGQLNEFRSTSSQSE